MVSIKDLDKEELNMFNFLVEKGLTKEAAFEAASFQNYIQIACDDNSLDLLGKILVDSDMLFEDSIDPDQSTEEIAQEYCDLNQCFYNEQLGAWIIVD